MLVIYIYVALASYNTGFLTLPMESIETVVDDAANIAVGKKKSELWFQGTDAVMDVPLGGVCDVLYGDIDSGE